MISRSCFLFLFNQIKSIPNDKPSKKKQQQQQQQHKTKTKKRKKRRKNKNKNKTKTNSKNPFKKGCAWSRGNCARVPVDPLVETFTGG